jgi:hypothetical protein
MEQWKPKVNINGSIETKQYKIVSSKEEQQMKNFKKEKKKKVLVTIYERYIKKNTGYRRVSELEVLIKQQQQQKEFDLVIKINKFLCTLTLKWYFVKSILIVLIALYLILAIVPMSLRMGLPGCCLMYV